jgi:transcriptional regulator with GAF, ATPase, and Fis domain
MPGRGFSLLGAFPSSRFGLDQPPSEKQFDLARRAQLSRLPSVVALKARRYDEALGHFDRDLTRAADDVERLQLMLWKGNALLGQARNREARALYFEVYREARQLRGSAQVRALGHKALMNAGLATKNLGEYDTAIQFYRVVLDGSLAGDPLQEIQLRGLLGSLLTRRGETLAAERELLRALAAARDLGEERLEADLQLDLAVLAYRCGQPADAEIRLERSRELAGEDPERRLRVELNLGTLLAELGDEDRAWIFFDKAQDLARRHDLQRYLPLILANQARIRQREQLEDEARRLAEEALRFADDQQQEDGWVRETCRCVLQTPAEEAGDDFRLVEALITRHEMVAVSPSMRRILRDIDALAASDLPVLVTGETGTGKELVARALHNAGPRRTAPFVPVNCPAIPETLFESTLFGHVKGAFTGADQDRKGLVELAGDGTIFLDEIGDLPVSIQPKLLRFLESGEYQRMGSGEVRFSGARILSATNRDLGELRAQRQFRDDLVMRISAFRIELPPLRERREDVYFIAASLLDGLNRRHGTAKAFAAAAVKRLNEYEYPGNVRELRNAVLRGYQTAEGEVRVEDLGLPSPAGRPPAIGPVTAAVKPGWLSELEAEVEQGRGLDLEAALRQLERRLIEKALDLRDGDRERTAEDLGLSPRALKYKITKHGIKSRKRRGPDLDQDLAENRP